MAREDEALASLAKGHPLDKMADAKGQEPRQSKFDVADRERLRAVILAYARENRIGAPNLQLRIADATKRSPDQIPLKTLQRFLKDEGRTNDGFLIPVAEFVAAVDAAGPHDALARDLGEFFSRGAADRPADVVPDRLVGEYEVWAGGTRFTDFKIRREGKFENPDVPYGRCRLSGSGRGLKVHETETGPGSGGADGDFRPPTSEGVMLFFSPLVFILLKNSMTRLSARFNNQEAEAVRELADRAGTSVASVIRGAVLNAPAPRATRRPTVNHQMAARLLGELGRIAEMLRAAIASGGADPKDPHIAAAFRDLSEMRTVCFLAMGRDP
jgi:hypothetical protein